MPVPPLPRMDKHSPLEQALSSGSDLDSSRQKSRNGFTVESGSGCFLPSSKQCEDDPQRATTQGNNSTEELDEEGYLLPSGSAQATRPTDNGARLDEEGDRLPTRGKYRGGRPVPPLPTITTPLHQTPSPPEPESSQSSSDTEANSDSQGYLVPLSTCHSNSQDDDDEGYDLPNDPANEEMNSEGYMMASDVDYETTSPALPPRPHPTIYEPLMTDTKANTQSLCIRQRYHQTMLIIYAMLKLH